MLDDFQTRLEEFLKVRNQPLETVQLTPDASTREYFRINWDGATAIACVYPESFIESEQTYLDVTKLFRLGGLPVAQIYDYNEALGVIVLEDFGDRILRDYLRQSDDAARNDLLNHSIRLIVQIQAATPYAFESDSIASRLKFDEEKLLWELNFFKTHYFETLRKIKLSGADDRRLNEEFVELARALETRAEVLCHRDFHAANLMLDRQNRLRIIDHQDARIGAASYDLVSLLLDRIGEPPAAAWLDEKKRFFLDERAAQNLKTIDPKDFDAEFQLQTVQRCLKAIGTFSFQSVNRGKTHFIPFIEPMLIVVRQAAERLDSFPHLRQIITKTLAE